MRKVFFLLDSESGIVHTLPLLLIVAAVGIISFLLVSSTAPFKGGLFGTLNPRPDSQAASSWAFEEKWDLGGTPGVDAPIPWHPTNWDIVSDSNDTDGVMDGQTLPEKTAIATDGVIEMGHGSHCEAPYNDTPGATQNPAMNNHNVTVDFDELKFQQNIRPQMAYICNNHLMTVAKAGYGITSIMPRQIFDWSGRTGTIEFETNLYAAGREWWDLYIVPQDEMLLQMANLNEGGNYEQNPKRAVKFKFGAQGVPEVDVIDNYEESFGWNYWQGFDQAFPNDPAVTDPKIRRVVSLQLSSIGYSYQIQKQDGTFWTFSGNFDKPLSFTQGLIRIEHHAYNPSKDDVQGVPWSQYTYHWDNFRFDGPVIPARTAFEPGPHFVEMLNAAVGTISPQPVAINVNVASATDIKNPLVIGHIISELTENDPTNATSFEQIRVNGGPWQKVNYVKDIDSSIPNPGKPRTWTTFKNSFNNIVKGNNTIEFKYNSRPAGATWQRNGFNAKDIEIQMDPVGVMSAPTPTPCMTNCPTPTPTTSPTPTPTPTPTPAPVAGAVTVDFNTKVAGTLIGQYPSGVINWGTNWIISAPFGQFATNSISFSGPTVNQAALSLIQPLKLVSLQAFNGGNTASTINLSCSGNSLVTQIVGVNQLVTITTNWTAACSNLTISSTNGWDTNFDNIVVAPVGSTSTPTPTPTPTPTSQGGSTLTISAGGQSGVFNNQTIRPTMVLNLSGNNVQTWTNVGGNGQQNQFLTFTYHSPTKVTHDQVRVRFTNDQYNATTGQDVNLFVKQITIDGITFPSNAPSVFSNGVWNQATGCAGGNKQSIMLSCNGFFQY